MKVLTTGISSERGGNGVEAKAKGRQRRKQRVGTSRQEGGANKGEGKKKREKAKEVKIEQRGSLVCAGNGMRVGGAMPGFSLTLKPHRAEESVGEGIDMGRFMISLVAD